MYFTYRKSDNRIVSYSEGKNKVDNKNLKQFSITITGNKKKKLLKKIQEFGTPDKKQLEDFISKI